MLTKAGLATEKDADIGAYSPELKRQYSLHQKVW